MPYKDPEKRRAHRRKPEVKARKAISDAKHYKNKRVHLIKRRRDILANYSCICCSEAEPCAIDWHHVDDETKSFNIATGMMRGEDAWWEEVCKCVPLCANCHRKLHNNKLCLIPIKR